VDSAFNCLPHFSLGIIFPQLTSEVAWFGGAIPTWLSCHPGHAGDLFTRMAMEVAQGPIFWFHSLLFTPSQFLLSWWIVGLALAHSFGFFFPWVYLGSCPSWSSMHSMRSNMGWGPISQPLLLVDQPFSTPPYYCIK
jgi:hypothetical protein